MEQKARRACAIELRSQNEQTQRAKAPKWVAAGHLVESDEIRVHT